MRHVPDPKEARVALRDHVVTRAAEARQRYEERGHRLKREARENDERLAAKAQAKLADLENQTRLTDPEAIARKRAVIEAALRRARERRDESDRSGS